MSYHLSIHRCPIHKDFFMVALDELNENGDGTGTRLTPTKCCGRWGLVKQWPLKSRDLREIANAFECAAEDSKEPAND